MRQPVSSRSMLIRSATAPERIWAPTSDTFSSTTTVRSGQVRIDLLQADRCRQALRTRADDDHVELHRSAVWTFVVLLAQRPFSPTSREMIFHTPFAVATISSATPSLASRKASVRVSFTTAQRISTVFTDHSHRE